jgi:hypothetical protein
MAVSTSNTTNGIEINLRAYHNCDDVQLFWRATVNEESDVPIPDCLGFSIERCRKNSDDEWGPTEVLRNRVGFSNEPDLAEDGTPQFVTKPSSVWPFQRYDWTDHGANSGQTVKYRVVAVGLHEGSPGEVELEPIADSGWTDPIRVNGKAGNVSAFFNRGAVMSQYVARLARKNNWDALDIKDHIAEFEEPIRRFLAGELRVELLRILDEVIENPDLSFYAALYELADDELIHRLQLLRGRAHIVLANGSTGDVDGNADARAALRSAHVDVRDRMLGNNKGLGHNKFGVVVRTLAKQAVKVWTGSTNWAATGLCTQLNNAIVFDDEDVAQSFFEQWQRLAAAQNGFPADLVQSNAQSPRNINNVDVWFTRVRNPQPSNTPPAHDIETLIDLINSARSVILYVMFQPGPQPLGSILVRAQNEPDIVVKGVVSTVGNFGEQFSLLGIDRKSKEYQTALIQPEGIVTDFSAWVKEVTRVEFLTTEEHPGIGHAITHAKMIVIDPFSDDCKVITGSHNFSKSASEKNDENFVVIHGNRRLAEAYAVACLSTYEHYRWRAYVKEKAAANQPMWDHLSDSPAWQEQCLTAAVKKTLSLWCPR